MFSCFTSSASLRSTSACTYTYTYICSHNAGASPDTYADPDTAASFERVGSFASRGG